VIELRLAVPADAMAVARVHVAAWRDGYRNLLPDAYLDGLRAEDRAARYTFDRADGPRMTVAIDSGAIVGFVTITVADCEVDALYVDRGVWGRGVGSALIARARADLAAAGVVEARLWMLVGNTRAQRFYERDGWTTDGTRRMYNVWNIDLDEIEYRRLL
jgi:ribosomal protein S18 acetylase RimI-like enzyme